MSQFEDLKKRFFLSVVIVTIVATCVAFSHIFLVSLVVAGLVTALSYFCMKEYLSLAKAKDLDLPEKFMLIGTVLLSLSFYLGSLLSIFSYFAWWVFFFLIFGAFLLSFKNIENSFQRVATAVLGFVYVSLPLGMIFPILLGSSSGQFWIFFLIAVVKVTDIAAYFGGRQFGKKLLAPKLSPKKTHAGAIWGLVFGSIVGASMSLIAGFDLIEMVRLTILAIFISSIGQLGDLAESLIKRDAQQKDSSTIPGIGGMLDMVDSLLFTIPVIFLYLG